MRLAAWRRRSLAVLAGERIQAEAERIAGERGILVAEAMEHVFWDQELLRRCHQVGEAPAPPRSTVDVQNAVMGALT